MEELLTIDAAKEHLRIDVDSEDEHLASLILAAIAVVENHLGRPIIDAAKGWATVDQVPANVTHAIKAVLADLYRNREKPLADETFLDRLVGRQVVVSFG